jgi:molybdenum cofactor cytidylyltransferase
MKTGIAIIILAAGSSSRMGTSKQLLPINGQSLLSRATQVALQTQAANTVIVLGSNEAEHRKAIEHLPVEIICNEAWQQGIGSSIKAGIDYVCHRYPETSAAIFMVCDQPFVTVDHLTSLIKEHELTSQPIVCSRYAATVGIPVLFEKSMFQNIMKLPDSAGAKRLIEQNPHLVTSVVLKGGEIDLDTPQDYNDFTSL